MITMLNMYDIMSLFVSRIVIMYDVVADINKTTNSHMIVCVAVQTVVNSLFLEACLCYFI
jgi:hypothetical protein